MAQVDARGTNVQRKVRDASMYILRFIPNSDTIVYKVLRFRGSVLG